jgi:hypothetical protein
MTDYQSLKNAQTAEIFGIECDPLSWWPFESIGTIPEHTHDTRISSRHTGLPLPPLSQIPFHDTTGTVGLPCSTEYAPNGSIQASPALKRDGTVQPFMTYRQGMMQTPNYPYGFSHGVVNGNSDSYYLHLQPSSWKLLLDEITIQFCGTEYTIDPSGSQKSDVGSSQLNEVRDITTNPSEASLMSKNRQPYHDGPRRAGATRPRSSQKETGQRLECEIAPPISYCSLSLFA